MYHGENHFKVRPLLVHHLLLRLIELWGGHFVKIFRFSWNVHVTQERSLIGLAVRKFRRSWNIWTSNANRAKDIFSSWSARFNTLRMSHAKKFSGDGWNVWVEIRVKGHFSLMRQACAAIDNNLFSSVWKYYALSISLKTRSRRRTEVLKLKNWHYLNF